MFLDSKASITLAALAALGLAAALPATAAVTYTENTTSYTGSYGGAAGTGAAGFSDFVTTNTAPAGTYAGEYIGSSDDSQTTNNGYNLDTGGNSFGFYANNGAATADVTQSFDVASEPSGLSAVGDSFSIDYIPGTNYNGDIGVQLVTASGDVGSFFYYGPYNTNPPASSTGSAASPTAGFYYNGIATPYLSPSTNPEPGVIDLTYTITSATTYSFSATGALTYAGVGTFSSPITGYDVQETYSGGGGGDEDSFFNDLSVTSMASAAPEPSQVGMIALMGLGLGGLLLSARKRYATGHTA